MRFVLFPLILSLILSLPVFAVDPKVLCHPAVLAELTSFEKERMEEACIYAGQYEQSALPDDKATHSGRFREGASATYEYSEFFQSLTRSLGKVNSREKCDTNTAPQNFSVAYPSLNLEKTAVGTIPISVVEEKELDQIFQSIAKDPKYAFDVPENGCWARAHIMARELEKKGIRVGKIFAEGFLTVETENALNGMGVSWSYHVAPLVAVKTQKGVELRVLDPSLFNKPVPVKTWTDKMIPKEEFKELTEETSVYTTDRFVLDPLRDQSVRAVRADPGRGRWHKAETIMAEQELQLRRQESEERLIWRQKSKSSQKETNP